MLPQRLPFQHWIKIGRQLSHVSTLSAWCLGDWLVYGETVYSGRYRDAVEETSLDYQTLRNYAWVARRIILSRRRETLSFGHHAEVAALSEPEQDFWLNKAEEFGWSRNNLRRQIRASLSEREQGPKDELSGIRDGQENGDQQIRISFTEEQLELCRRAAVRTGLAINDWAVQTLSHAAYALLDSSDLDTEKIA